MTARAILIACAAAAALLIGPADAAVTPAANVHVTAYRNAQVWNGHGFDRRTLYVAGGRFLKGAPAGATVADVDLQNHFVVPALGSAHEHKINPNPESDWAYFDDGVFYLWNANGIVETAQRKAYYNRPTTVDYATAMGGVSEPGGHPEGIYLGVLRKYVYRDVPKEAFLNDAFHYGRTPSEIDDALDRLTAQGADFVKGFLLFSEDYAARKADPSTEGVRGLSPANFRYLVSAAKRRGLETRVHVETVADLMTAASAGASVAMHLPGFDLPRTGVGDDRKFMLTADDARRVVRAHMLIVPTYIVARSDLEDEERAGKDISATRNRVARIQRNNLRQLVKAGAVLLTGTDISGSIVDEVQQWVDVGGVSRETALRFALATGRRMFPERRVGCFDPRCAADFLVLRDDPRKDLRALRSIVRMVKGGEELKKPAAK